MKRRHRFVEDPERREESWQAELAKKIPENQLRRMNRSERRKAWRELKTGRP